MKSVLISIRPKWCEKICHEIGKEEAGKPIYEKRIEVRKTAPKEVPFKAYIYETYDKKYDDIGICWGKGKCFEHGCKKVIGEFICNRIDVFTPSEHGIRFKRFRALYETCLTVGEMRKYANGKPVYGWHISDLKIYDKPKELSEFRKKGFMTEEEWLFNLYPNTHCHYEAWAKKFEIARPPQSWCYVEELEK